MDKPISMSVKEYLMRIMSLRTNTPLKTIEAVIDFQFSGLHEAMIISNSVEISGFGKFLFNKKKAKTKLIKYTIWKKQLEKELKSVDISDKRRRSVEIKLTTISRWMADIKPRIESDKYYTNCGRMEEYDIPSGTFEVVNPKYFS